MELCTRLDSEGFSCTLAALEPGSIGGLDIPVLGPTRFSRRTLSTLRSLAQASDLVLAHGSSTLPAVSIATSGLSARFVYRSIGDPVAWATSRSRRLRIRTEIRRAAGVAALWRGSAVFWHEVLGVLPQRIRVIPNWVSAAHFPAATPQDRVDARASMGLPSDAPIAMYLGALTEEKRVDLAVRAVGLLSDFVLAIVGDGPERATLETLAGEWPNRVRVLGPTAEPARALAAADVLVLPSRTEGQPAAAIEAGLTGIPVVAARVGGLEDIVLDGLSGILVDAQAIAPLAAAISSAVASREAMGAAGRKHCLATFDLDRIAQVWASFLQQAHSG